MNYELAKKLKEAGFPQIYTHLPSPKGGYTQYHTMDVVWNDGLVQRVRFEKPYWEMRDGDKWTQAEMENASVAKIPTLSELIEAVANLPCYIRLSNGHSGWGASAIPLKDFPNNDGVEGLGPTPEIAVANLWLQLNKRQQ